MQKLLYIALFLVLSQPVWAQTEGDATAEETKMDFVQQVREDLLSIKTDHADATALFFQNSWDGGKFSSDSKMKVQELYHQFKEKNYNASQYRLPFIAAITGAAQNLAQADAAINTYLTVLERAITELPANEFRKILVSADLVLREKALYQTKQYELAFSGGGVSFEWKEPEPIVQEPVETEESSSEDGWGSQSDDGWGSTEQDDAWGSDSNSDGWGDNNTDAWDTETEEITTPAPSNQGLGLFQPTPMPVLNGPVVKLRNINLHLNSVFDSVEVSNTTATLDLTSKTLVAEGGIFTWEHLGIGRDSLSVELENYTMEVNKPVLLAENATLTYPSKVNKPVKGLLEYRVEKRSKTKQPEYPVFQSYKSGYKLNIVNQNGLTVTGGVTLKGKTLSTGSLDNGFSQMDLQGQAVKKFRAQSREQTEKAERMRSLLNLSTNAIISSTADGAIETFNHAAERIFGYSAEDIIGSNVRILMPQSDSVQHDTYMQNYIQTGEKKVIGKGRRVTAKKSNGDEFPAFLALNEGFANGKRFFVGMITDITDTVNKEQAQLKKEEELLKEVESLREQLNNTVQDESVQEIKELQTKLSKELNQKLQANEEKLKKSIEEERKRLGL
jgi:PAS domain S-box-containing protein